MRTWTRAKQRPGRISASSRSPMFGRLVEKMIFRPCELPNDLPYLGAAAIWMIRIYGGAAPKAPIDFVLPLDMVFPEEYSAA